MQPASHRGSHNDAVNLGKETKLFHIVQGEHFGCWCKEAAEQTHPPTTPPRLILGARNDPDRPADRQGESGRRLHAAQDPTAQKLRNREALKPIVGDMETGKLNQVISSVVHSKL